MMETMFGDKLIDEAFNEHCARECEEYSKKCERVANQAMCPHCGAIWEDVPAMLTCPCSDPEWIR